MAKKKKIEIKYPEGVDDKFQLWSNRISSMRIYMENACTRKKWKRLQKYYESYYRQYLGLKIPIVVVNEVYNFVKTAIANLFARNPKFKCNPNNSRSIINAKIAEQVVNYYWYTRKIKRQVKKCLKDGKLFGYSWMKVGYNAKTGTLANGSEFIEKEDIFSVFRKHDSIWYDAEALDPPYDCKWMLDHFLMPTDKANERWPDRDIKPTSQIDYTSGCTKMKENLLKPKDREVTRIYEIWDKENKVLLYYTEGYDKGFLEEKKWPYKMKGYPFVMLKFDELIDMDEYDNIPNPEINKFLDQILEKIKLRSLELNHLKRFSRQMIASKSALDESEEQKYKLGIDGAIIKADTEGQSIDNVIRPIAYAAMQPEVYAVENRLDIDLARVSGQQGGGQIPTRSRTLGEVEEVTAVSDARTLEQQDIVEEFTEEIARKVIALMRQFFDGERYARIIGDVTDPITQAALQRSGTLEAGTVKWTKKNIQGEYDIEVVAGSTLPMSPATRLRNLLQIARFGPAFGLTPNSITSRYLGKAIMEELELKDVSKAYDQDIKQFLQPKQPDPMEQMRMIEQKQKIDNRAADTKLKNTRIEGNNLSNVGKAVKNADAIEEVPKTQEGV